MINSKIFNFICVVLLLLCLYSVKDESPVIKEYPFTTSLTTTETICLDETVTKESITEETAGITESTTEETTEHGEGIGEFTITVYTPYCDNGRWGYGTATNTTSQHLKTCAVDPNVIPLGSTIEVNGLVLKAVDTGSDVRGNKIDIFYDGSVEEAYEWLENEFGAKHNVKIIN